MPTKLEQIEARGGGVFQSELKRLKAFGKEHGRDTWRYFQNAGFNLESAILLMIKDGEIRKDMENLALWLLLDMEGSDRGDWDDSVVTVVQTRNAFLDVADSLGFFDDDEITDFLGHERDGAVYLVAMIKFRALFNFFSANEENFPRRKQTLRTLLLNTNSLNQAMWEQAFWTGVLQSLLTRTSFGD